MSYCPGIESLSLRAKIDCRHRHPRTFQPHFLLLKAFHLAYQAWEIFIKTFSSSRRGAHWPQIETASNLRKDEINCYLPLDCQWLWCYLHFSIASPSVREMRWSASLCVHRHQLAQVVREPTPTAACLLTTQLSRHVRRDFKPMHRQVSRPHRRQQSADSGQSQPIFWACW